jgi:hypothetical protein
MWLIRLAIEPMLKAQISLKFHNTGTQPNHFVKQIQLPYLQYCIIWEILAKAPNFSSCDIA